jgi:predicted  nucleic acid-binding Zn-ribbon protein
MPEDRTDDLLGRRLALYAYLEPLLSGRRVLEVRPSAGRSAAEATADSAQYLRSLGARVVSVEGDPGRIDDRFDVVIVPQGDDLARRAGAVAALRRLLTDGGRVIIAVANVDRGGAGLGYYDLHGAVAASFAHVQMLGMTPFLGMGVVEFEGAVDGLRIDSRLVKEGSEPPAMYVAVAGTQVAPALGYALVQLPFAPLEARLASPAAAARAPEVSGPSSALLREEIEELRGRLRRAAEDRAALDDEIAKLRRALADADESVLNLTRKTTDEMSAMAARLAAGLRSSAEVEARAPSAELTAARDEAARLRARLAEAEARASAAEQRLEEVGGAARARQAELEDVMERLRLSDSELARARRHASRLEEESKNSAVAAESLAARDQALAARDDRIARLESEKQDLVWRMAELEDKLTATIARAVRGDSGRVVARPPETEAHAENGRREPSDEGRASRERVLDEFHKAATVHVGEITELRSSVAEQSALVAELEDAVAAAEARAAASAADASTLRQTAKSLEEADRSRRSRLAELEGKLLRFEHERKSAPPPAALEEERAAWSRERDQLRGEIEKLAAVARGHNGHHAAAQKLDAMAAGVSEAAPPDDAVASRLENTLGNYRQRASRLRDELEGVRRRFDALSPSEIAVFLEELGDDLAELGK